MVSAWLDVDHLQVVKGHWANGLANRLDGTEDHFLRGDAADIYQKRNMRDERTKIVETVKSGWAVLGAHPERTHTRASARALIGKGISQIRGDITVPLLRT